MSSFTPLQRENIGLLCIIKRREEERKAQQRSYSWNIQRLIISPPPQVAAANIPAQKTVYTGHQALSWSLAVMMAMFMLFCFT